MMRAKSRRSFLTAVLGGAVLFGGAGPAGGARFEARKFCGRRRGRGSGITDTDAGPGADPAHNGRGNGAPAGPPRGFKQARPATGVTDRDSGASADPVNRGRRPRRSAITDGDAGAVSDRPCG